MWINYHPDREDEVVNRILKYLETSWAEARWQYDEDYRNRELRAVETAKIVRAETLRLQLAAAEKEAEAAKVRLETMP